MRLIFLIVLAVALSACGKRPQKLDYPDHPAGVSAIDSNNSAVY